MERLLNLISADTTSSSPICFWRFIFWLIYDMPELPWFLLGTVGLITLYALHRQFNRKKIEVIDFMYIAPLSA